ncbi:coiled-coil domain-containing protein [Herbiconiux sp. UC225_62]|uniref:coiled-coil domain-containing protein n=1 Tax=Herbiconiux sp. UC225_62 TaxID=3350168 RepID=UPI0036D2DA52
MWKSPARALGVVAALVALVATPNLAASATPAAAPGSPAGSVRIDYPSWDEVNAAKQNEQQKQKEVNDIQAALTQLQAESDQRTQEALQRGQEYLQATYDLQAATTYAATLDAQAASATEKASTANTQAGQIVAQLYRAGGDSTLSLILNQNDSDSLLYQLGTMSKLTEQTAGIRDAALAAQNTADALTAQADVAKAERDRLSQEANVRLQAAEDAQAEAAARVAEEKAHKDQLFAQLASLQNTTAALEKQRADGIAQEEADRKKQAEEAAAAAGGGGSAWVPGDGSIMSPAEAQAYAASIMPSYGWDDAQFNCLVRLWIGESGWRANALNESSGAYGIPQSLPANKMASVADDYLTNAATQIIWGANYIAGRYGNPCTALSTWTARNPHWY